jgi:hypothetical protein
VFLLTRQRKEEIFGPVMPDLGYTDLDEVLKGIRSRPHPLSIFYFGNDEEQTRRVLVDQRSRALCRAVSFMWIARYRNGPVVHCDLSWHGPHFLRVPI